MNYQNDDSYLIKMASGRISTAIIRFRGVFTRKLLLAASIIPHAFYPVTSFFFFCAQFLGSMFIMDVTVVCMLFFAFAIDKVRVAH